jgi:hypothetical protein
LPAGDVTTANNGGFASVRSAPWSGWSGLHGAEALELEVQGDGRIYKLNLKVSCRLLQTRTVCLCGNVRATPLVRAPAVLAVMVFPGNVTAGDGYGAS